MDQRFLDIGLYSIPQASRLNGVPASAIRRWLWGYYSRSNGIRRFISPLWTPQPAAVAGVRTLSFRDLVELRFVHSLRQQGVSMPRVRTLRERAEVLLGSRPFSALQFKTEGARLAAELGCGEVHQSALVPLYEDLDFSATGKPVRWWPLGRRHEVVIDPRRSFGRPVVHEKSISAGVLADAYETEGSIEAVARWYDVSETAVRDAVEFQLRTAEVFRRQVFPTSPPKRGARPAWRPKS